LRRARASLEATSAPGADVGRCDGGLALVHLHRGELDDAEGLASSARARVDESAQLVAAQLDIVLGRVAWSRGNRDRSLECYRSAVRLLTGHAGDRSAAAVWYELGALLDEAGDLETARDAYRSAAASMGLRAEPAAAAVIV